MTPNYLGFLQAMPKESPIERGITSAMQGYGDVQKLREQTAEAQALPKEIEQKQQYMQGLIDQKQLLLKSMPQALQAKITDQQLTNTLDQQKIVANRMSAQQNQDSYFSSKVASLREAEQSGLDKKHVNNQYQRLRKQMIDLGDNPANIPKTYDDRVKSIGDHVLTNSPAAIEARKFSEAMQKQALINKGKLDEKKAAGMQDNPEAKSFMKSEGEANSKYITSVTQGAAATGRAINSLDSLMAVAQQHPDYFGYVRGKVTGQLTPEGSAALSNAYNVVLNEAQGLKGLATIFRTSTMQKVLLQAKPRVDQPYGAFIDTIKRHLVEQRSMQEQAKFVNWAENNGIRNRRQLSTAWTDFMNSAHIVDKQGKYHPENVSSWGNYFANNPDKLPPALANVMAKNVQTAAQQTGVSARGGLILPGTNTNQLLMGQ